MPVHTRTAVANFLVVQQLYTMADLLLLTADDLNEATEAAAAAGLDPEHLGALRAFLFLTRTQAQQLEADCSNEAEESTEEAPLVTSGKVEVAKREGTSCATWTLRLVGLLAVIGALAAAWVMQSKVRGDSDSGWPKPVGASPAPASLHPGGTPAPAAATRGPVSEAAQSGIAVVAATTTAASTTTKRTTTTLASTTTERREKSGGCEFVEGVQFYADRYLIGSTPATSKEDCCRICQEDDRCMVGQIKEGNCFMRRVVVGETATFPEKGNTAVVVSQRAPAVDIWGPASWAREEEDCRKQRGAYNATPAANTRPKLPPAAMRALLDVARERRAALAAGDGGAGFEAVGVALPLPVALPSGADPLRQVVGGKDLGQLKTGCVTYIVSTRSDVDFAEAVAKVGCKAHVFACSNELPTESDSIKVHDWCVADKSRLTDGAQKAKGLLDTLKLLQHSEVSLLRLNGDLGNWRTLEPELEQAKGSVSQLSLRLCGDAGSDAGDEASAKGVFLRLHDMGFLVTAVDHGGSCAEFALLHVTEGDEANLPEAASLALAAASEAARVKLEEGMQEHHGSFTEKVFNSVDIVWNLKPPVIDHDWRSGNGQGNKNLVGMPQLTQGGRKCVVYGIGIAGDSGFEQKMSALGCETHAFDCTISPDSPAVKDQKFEYHHWCIGEGVTEKNFGNVYVSKDADKLEFKTLVETMKLLGHTKIDVLKFDIEGHEWKLFEDVILNGVVNIEQISFELHTMRASPNFVPKKLTHCVDSVATTRLFVRLWNMGYRTVSREVNDGDPACAEFVMLNVR